MIPPRRVLVLVVAVVLMLVVVVLMLVVEVVLMLVVVVVLMLVLTKKVKVRRNNPEKGPYAELWTVFCTNDIVLW